MSVFTNPTRAFFAANTGARVSIAALLILFVVVGANAQQTTRWQKARRAAIEQKALAAPSLNVTLNDAFPDSNNDGKAAAGETVTYTATVTNNGTTEATNAIYTNTVDNKSTLVANSTRVQSSVNGAIRCTFSTASGGSGDCSQSSAAFGATDSNLNAIIGGQNSNVTLAPANIVYDAATQTFQFDATVQNLVPNSLSTLDGTTLDTAGVRLFVQNTSFVGTGAISAANADGAAQFTLPNQPYFQYNEILAQNAVSSQKTLRFNVPNTVSSFTVEFLISTKAQVLLVINEILVNPANFNSSPDATGEWFELYNAGAFALDLQNFLINDNSVSGSPGEGCYDGSHCHRTPFAVASSLPIAPGGYLVFGNSSNTSNNGGVPVDYQYGAVMAFSNSVDGLRLRTPAATNSLTIDQAYYSSAAISAQDGISRELKNPALDNINFDGSNWASASATAVYGSGGRGTPKAQNSVFTPAPPPVSLDETKRGGAHQFAAPTAGETVTANLGTIPAGASVVITYQVKVVNRIPAGTTEISTQATVSGDNFTSVASDDPATAAANDATATPVLENSATAASVSVGGRALTSAGRGIKNVRIRLTDRSGNVRTAITTAFGYYRFADVGAGETVVITAQGKRFAFAEPAQVLNINEDTSDVNFVAY